MKSGEFRISVLMSIYENEKPENLFESVESIFKQTILPKEIVIVHDGVLTKELDSTIQMLKIKSTNINVKWIDVILENNCGLGIALNEGTKYISNELIARVDTDDICVPERFELQVKEFKNNQNLGLLGGQVTEFEENVQNIVGKRRVPCEDGRIREYCKFRNPFNHPSVMIKKEILFKAGGYQDFKGFEDYYLWSRVLINDSCVVKNLSRSLVYMRVNKGTYDRRGGLKYLKNYFKLRKFLFKNKMISKSQMYIGDGVMVLNILVPSPLRSIFYRNILHKR